MDFFQTIPNSPAVVAVDAADDAALRRLVAAEKTIVEKQFRRTDRLDVKIDWSHRSVTLYNGVVVKGKIDRPFLHQVLTMAGLVDEPEVPLGALSKPSREIWAKWITPEVVRTAFFNPSAKARLLPTPITGTFQLYGLVGVNYRPTNQTEVRADIIRRLHDLFPSQEIHSTGTLRTWQTAIVERFALPESLSVHGFSGDIHVRYGVSNGYGSYRLGHGRTVIVCTNQLHLPHGSLPHHTTALEWRHNNPEPIGTFVSREIHNLRVALEQTARAWDHRSAAPVTPSDAGIFFRRINAAPVSVQRVKARFDIERQVYGHTQWALSQALTWVATHQRDALAPAVADRFSYLGTRILDDGLDSTLAEPLRQDRQGFIISPLLPES